MLEANVDKVKAKAEEIIKLATKLGNEEEKASRYVDLAYALVNIRAKDGSLNEDNFAESLDYFEKAINIYKDLGNEKGEANIYQAMGDLLSNVGKFEDSLQLLIKAQKIYNSLNSKFEAAITHVLIGLLVLNPGVLNDKTYRVADEHFNYALRYFKDENIKDLVWKILFYLAELNARFFKVCSQEDKFLELAAQFFLEMKAVVDDIKQGSNSFSMQGLLNMDSVSPNRAFKRAKEFFEAMEDKEAAEMFQTDELA